MQKILPFAVVIAAVVFVGCSAVDSKAEVKVDGTLLRQDSSAVNGLRVLLVRIPDPIELLAGGTAVVASVGRACLAPSPPTICKVLQVTKTDADGGFAYEMKGSDVKGTFGQVSLFNLMAGLDGPTAGSVGSTVIIDNFVIQKERLTLPTLKFWEMANVSAAVTASQATVSWDLIGASHGHEPSAGYFGSFSGASGEVWRQSVTRGGMVDARALEDTAGTFNVSAHDKVGGGGFLGGNEFNVHYGSVGTTYSASTNPLPRSRGKACTISTIAGSSNQSPCPLTNGLFGDSIALQTACPASSADAGSGMDAGSTDAGSADAGASADGGTPGTATCSANKWVEVDLGSTAPLSSVYVHGLAASGKMVVETSLDGVGFIEAAQWPAERYHATTLPLGTVARYVRLRALESAISGLNELSVW